MTTKTSWSVKQRVWTETWVRGVPLDRLRHEWPALGVGDIPAWATLRKVLREFLSLEEGSDALMDEPLRSTWLKWDRHFKALRALALSIPGDLLSTVVIETGDPLVDFGFNTVFAPLDEGNVVNCRGCLRWQQNDDKLDVWFTFERDPVWNQFRQHTSNSPLHVLLKRTKADLRSRILGKGPIEKSLQPLAYGISKALDGVTFTGPGSILCIDCPPAAPGAFTKPLPKRAPTPSP